MFQQKIPGTSSFYVISFYFCRVITFSARPRAILWERNLSFKKKINLSSSLPFVKPQSNLLFRSKTRTQFQLSRSHKMQGNYLDFSGVFSTPGHSSGQPITWRKQFQGRYFWRRDPDYFPIKAWKLRFLSFLSAKLSCLKPLWLTYGSKSYGFIYA